MAPTVGGDGLQQRRGAKEKEAAKDDEDVKKKPGADGEHFKPAHPNDSPYREKIRRELLDGAFEKLLANLGALVIVGGVVWILIKIGIL